MIILAGTTELVSLITSAAGTVDVHESHVDRDGAATPITETPDSTNTAITTATTTTVVASPTGTNKRNVKHLFVKNKSATVSNTITLQHYDGTTTVQLAKVTLLPGEFLIVDDRAVVYVYDGQGGVKGAPSGDVNPQQNDFRLSGVSATPVMTADSTTLSTIFLTQFKGNRIALFDGTNWQLAVPASEVSLAVSGRTTDLPFDIFAFLSAGVVTLEFLNWTSATARATGLTRVDGVWTKTGDSTRRYLGSCRPRSATTFHWVMQGVDLPAKFDLFNADNRQQFNFGFQPSSASWAYTLATLRQQGGLTNMQVDLMVGLQEEFFEGFLTVNSSNSTISIGRTVGIGFDSTTAIVAGCNEAVNINTVASIQSSQTARLSHQPTIGRHFYAWLEASVATGVCTWVGRSATAGFNQQSGMVGEWQC